MRPHRHRKGWRGWGRIRSVHRRLVAVLLLAFGLGATAGLAFGATQASAGVGAWCAAIGALLALWPLGWMATLLIARPMVQLARVAQQLRGGQLSRREALRNGPDEVGEVAGALRGMADRVARQLDHQRALMAAVSHELRSPLARVRVLVELAREDRAPAGLHDDLQAEIDGMDALVGDLLAASRIDFEAVTPRLLDVGEVCARAVELSPTDPVLDLASAGQVQADPTLLARALGVLLDNAHRYGAPPVTLKVRTVEGQVRFVVRDCGEGFAPGEEEQAFQPFWRRPGTPGGAGLGLALVRQIAEAHEGSAWADNHPDGGGRVTLALPAP
ncbi:MAG: HAMP domain-containing histidine kinase [Myxococcales bacterium]|nr:HAMP domain-containing histidine kinase [Myxococcales bacterium]